MQDRKNKKRSIGRKGQREGEEIQAITKKKNLKKGK
jgi:hypothetical protein